VEIDSDADSAVVTWWETNQTFGPMLVLATNGTIGEVEATEEGE